MRAIAPGVYDNQNSDSDPDAKDWATNTMVEAVGSRSNRKGPSEIPFSIGGFWSHESRHDYTYSEET